MVTNRSRAYPRRSGKRDVRLEISVFGFEGTTTFNLYKRFKAQWLSWLERRPVTAEVVGSSPIWVVLINEGS